MLGLCKKALAFLSVVQEGEPIMKHQKHIDGLRALAVLSVFFMHLGIPGFSGGFVGVDVFL